MRAEPGLPLRLEGVTKRFGDTLALEGVSLRLAPGQFTAVVGPSGCGKTTLLRIAAGLVAPDAGTVDPAPGTPGVGICFQDPRLLPWRTAVENVALPLELAGAPRAGRKARAREALGRVQLADRAEALPAALSGGMRMRVALARALVTDPRLLLLDEPFGSLDEITRQELDDMLSALQADHGFTAVLVTHSIAEAVSLADEVVVLSRGPGRVVGLRRVERAGRGAEARQSRAFQEQVAALAADLDAAAHPRGAA
jgi:NitT/TauT family transport system ATP-binding protein